MLIFWRGRGYLVAGITFLCSLLMEMAIEALTNDRQYYQNNTSLLSISMLISGLLIWKLGRTFNVVEEEKQDSKSGGKKASVKQSPDFIFVRMEYWGIVVMIIAIVHYASIIYQQLA